MANGRMADPSDEHAIRYSLLNARKPSIRTKAVKADPSILADWYGEERKLLFHGLLYFDASLGGVYVPADNLLYMVHESVFGYGSTAKGGARLLSVLHTDREAYPLKFSGPKDPDVRFEAGLFRQSVVTNRALGGAKVRVLQPYFEDWSLRVKYSWPIEATEPGFLGKGRDFDAHIFLQNLTLQGHSFGLGAYRKSPNYGTFDITVHSNH